MRGRVAVARQEEPERREWDEGEKGERKIWCEMGRGEGVRDGGGRREEG